MTAVEGKYGNDKQYLVHEVLLVDDVPQKRLENAGGFFCEACLMDKLVDRRSPDPRYCQDCYDFLTEEAKLLSGTRCPKWVPKKSLI